MDLNEAIGQDTQPHLGAIVITYVCIGKNCHGGHEQHSRSESFSSASDQHFDDPARGACSATFFFYLDIIKCVCHMTSVCSRRESASGRVASRADQQSAYVYAMYAAGDAVAFCHFLPFDGSIRDVEGVYIYPTYGHLFVEGGFRGVGG